MLTAIISVSSKQVLAQETNKKDGPFKCPECEDPVLLKKGKIRVAHFAHIPPVTCSYGMGESELHRTAKISIYEALRKNSRVTKLQLERSLGQVRPDISFCLDDKRYVAIEVQASKLPPAEIVRRTRLYKSKNISVLWMPPFKVHMKNEGVYRPSQWELLIHAMYFGRTYYWMWEDKAVPVRYIKRREWVPGREWYDSYGDEQSAGDHWKYYKADRILKILPVVSIVDMQTQHRKEFSAGVFEVPECFLWSGPSLPPAPDFMSAKSEDEEDS